MTGVLRSPKPQEVLHLHHPTSTRQSLSPHHHIHPHSTATSTTTATTSASYSVVSFSKTCFALISLLLGIQVICFHPQSAMFLKAIDKEVVKDENNHAKIASSTTTTTSITTHYSQNEE
jgi:hypothetical protein